MDTGPSSPSNHEPNDVPPAGPTIWFYRDVQGNEQGPFDSACMRSWYEQGYFAADQLIRGLGAENQPLHQLWERPEEAFVAAVASGTAGAARVEYSPVPSKRQRVHGPAPRSPEAAPVMDLRTASLYELYEDRLAVRVAPDDGDDGDDGDGGGGGELCGPTQRGDATRAQQGEREDAW